MLKIILSLDKEREKYINENYFLNGFIKKKR